jgi:hypothetical protein
MPPPRVKDEGIVEHGSIRITVGDRDLQALLADHIEQWLLEHVPTEIRLRVNWTIQQEFTVMDLRDGNK